MIRLIKELATWITVTHQVDVDDGLGGTVNDGETDKNYGSDCF